MYNGSSCTGRKWRRPNPGKITGLLKAWVGGDDAAREQLIPLVYRELRRIAQHYCRKAGAGNTLQTTSLLHETYLRLVDIEGVDWQDRVHFFAVSAQVMRRILVDVLLGLALQPSAEGSTRFNSAWNWMVCRHRIPSAEENWSHSMTP